MSKQWQLRRGTTAENNEFTGAQGELTMDTDTNALRIHDGITQGGHMIDCVVAWQAPTAENNYTWYRKYASGWVEQGGVYTISSSSPHTITLPQQMSSINYDINIAAGYPGVGDNTVNIHIRTDMITTTSFAIQKHWSSNNGAYYWRVSGMAAQS